MDSATPLDTEIIKDAQVLECRGEIPVTSDRKIYDELIAPLEDTMMRCIWRVVRNADLAEDCLQDALAIVWKKRFRIRRHPNPRALILKICLNTACDSLRKLERMLKQTDLSRMADIPSPPDRNADRSLEESEFKAQVQQAINRLPRKRALAVMMRLIHEESFEAIAQTLGCSEGTVRIHLSRGRAQLRKWLSPLMESKRQEIGDE
jgi:RNA polymerase sigma-70 factor (ECF subfamily)